jgi:hypothetical protein
MAVVAGGSARRSIAIVNRIVPITAERIPRVAAPAKEAQRRAGLPIAIVPHPDPEEETVEVERIRVPDGPEGLRR